MTPIEKLRRWQAIAERHKSQTADVDAVALREGADEIERLAAIVEGARIEHRGDATIRYGWDCPRGRHGWCYTLDLSHLPMEWAGDSIIDAWMAVREAAEKARAT